MKIKKATYVLPFIILCGTLSACSLAPDLKKTDTVLPQNWQLSGDSATRLEGEWWQAYHDKKLEELIAQALAYTYLAKLWPSAVGLCNYIQAHPALVKDKIVVELAAVLGLPSLLAATHAKQVICSDYAEEALSFVKRSVALNDITNIESRLIDWQHYPDDLRADVVLLSDINYDPGQFEILHILIKSLLNQGTIVILSTPQRIMGKPFIEALLPYCTAKQAGCVEIAGSKTEIFIMQLEKAI